MFADLGFALSALGYCALLLLLFTVRKAGLAKHLLVLATATTAVWAVSHINLLFGPLSVNKILLMDTIKQLFWLVFLLSCIQDDFQNLRQVLARPASFGVLALPLAMLTLPWFVTLDLSAMFMGQTILALEVLLLLELIYRQAGSNRWAFKPLVLFLGATSLFEFVTYANALMVGKLEVTYIAARGYIYFALLPALVLAIRRIKHWGINIFISRHIVLQSSLLLVAGGYLFFMAMVGYAVKFIGGSWGTSIQIVLFAISLALLATVFLSNSFRIKIKVFITKHFFANQYDYREEWLKLTEALEGTENDIQGVYRSALKGLLKAVDYRSGILVKCTGYHLNPVVSVDHNELSDNEIELINLLHGYVQDKRWIIDVEELRYKPFNYEGLKINHALLNDCSFHLVLPFYQGGKFWGLALLAAGNTTNRLNWEVRDYLTAVSAQVSSYIFHHEASQEVAENAQFAAFSRMSAFVLHDLKNVLAQIDLILCNAEQHKANPEFIDDTFETLHHTKARMEKMLRQLTEKNEAPQQSESLVTVSDLLADVIAKKCAGLNPLPQLTVQDELPIVIDEEKFGNVLYHLLSNAQQATEDDGFVNVSIDKSVDDRLLYIQIQDNGTGMSQSFIENRLFKPFDTTKGNAGMGIGAYDAKNFIEKIGGRLEVSSEESVGSTFSITLPIE